jgi:rubrerythrin
LADVSDVELLEICRRIEETMARLYHRLAEMHAGHEVQALWHKTAREEENHALQFELLQRRPDLPPVRIDAARALKALEVAETVLAGYELEAPSVAAALEEAMLLEHSLAQYHADLAVAFPNDEQNRLFGSMMAADADHFGALQAALERERAQR